jgi:putative flavoprotein involved in K+ transport
MVATLLASATMGLERVEVAIVGGGQAGLALSYRLTELGRDHVILEQRRLVESWRSKRWDSLRVIAPNWSVSLPGLPYPGDDPDGFMARDEVVTHLEGYAASFSAPVREGCRVVAVEAATGGGFTLRTEDGSVAADQVVLATGALQRPNIPVDVEIPRDVDQLIAADYRQPGDLSPKGVLIVGSGETGSQIAEELARTGHQVWLSGGRAWWTPRRYRGRDIAAWFRVTGWLDRRTADLPPGKRTGQSNPQLTGADGGHDISSHTLARDGVRLLGRSRGFRDGRAYFADDVVENLAWGDAQARNYLETVERAIREQAIDAPDDDLPADLRQGTAASAAIAGQAPRELDLAAAGLGTVLWATGYRPAFSWVGLPFLESDGYPRQRRGVTDVEGLYVLGLDWLHSARSGLFAGIDEDATYLAGVIAARA